MSRSPVNFQKEDGDGYGSSFEDDDEVEKTEKRRRKHSFQNDKLDVKMPSTSRILPPRDQFLEEQRRAEGYRNRYFALNAYERHRKLVNDYLLYYPGSAADVLKRDASKDRNDMDIVREHHRFVWREEDEGGEHSWEKDLAKKYYDKLFKEYGVCDLSRYKENKIAIRWRIQQEVVDGKGQFTCGEKKCPEGQELRTWEVNFAYLEDRVKKNALVKLRLCPACSLKLNFSYKRKEVTKKPKKRKHHRSHSRSKNRRDSDNADVGTSSSSTSDPKSAETETEAAAENIWKAPVIIPELKSREEEFNEYLEDLFL